MKFYENKHIKCFKIKTTNKLLSELAILKLMSSIKYSEKKVKDTLQNI